MAFTERTTCPDSTEQWWQASYSPFGVGPASQSSSANSSLPSCTAYAWGRFAEIMNDYPTGLPTVNADEWYTSDTTHEKGTEPKLGAVLVLKSTRSRTSYSTSTTTSDKSNASLTNVVGTKSRYNYSSDNASNTSLTLVSSSGAGHVAIVERINSDGSIVTSESSSGSGWNKRWWTETRYPPNYCNSPYQFVGFIYNPAVDESDTSTLDISDPNHPAMRFVNEAASHVGDGGHAWVQSMVPIGNQHWCAATMCAVAKACGFNGIIMPDNDFTASGFGKQIVDVYGGEYHAGPMMGESFTPQPGDIIEYYKGYATSGTFNAGTRYAAYHVGVVQSADETTVYTIEGNTSNTYAFREKNINGDNIGWYARPDWTKVGGSMTVGQGGQGGYGGGQLYATASTRADATLREVGYLDSDCKPSIESTDIRLCAINYTDLLSGLVKLFGGAGTSSGGTPDNIDALDPIPREIVRFFQGKGCTTALGIGVIANIKRESDFNTAAAGDKTASGTPTSFGICQWHNERGTAMKQMAGSDWANNLTGQLNYLWHELNSSYSGVLSEIQSKPNTLQGALDVTEIWCRKFEVPSDVDNEVKLRQGYCEEFWNQVVVASTNASPTGVSAAAQTRITNQAGTVLTNGTRYDIPSSVQQTGIIAMFTSYPKFYGNWASGTIQSRLAAIWGEQGKPSQHFIATISGYYLIAISQVFGTTGDIVSVVLEDNTYFNAILGDAKKFTDANSSQYGHLVSGKVDVIEWESAGSDKEQDTLRQNLASAGWLGKKVSYIVNYGPWLS